ncbi:MAG: hypothetical protein RR237_03950, partial [Acetivibrio sp.]
MNKYNLKILELYRDKNKLYIGARVKCPYDPTVKEPKLAMIFDNGTETRRMPLLCQTYFPEETLTRCTIFAKYNYKLDYIFFKKPVNKKIDFYIEFTYGGIVIEKMPFIISSDVKFGEDEEYDITYSEDRKQFTLYLKEEIKAPPKLSLLGK